MAVNLIPPELSVANEIRNQLLKAREALFTVAYATQSGFDQFYPALRVFLGRRGTSFRILLDTTEMRTEPAVLRMAYHLRRGFPRRVRVRCTIASGFHAKVYAFRGPSGAKAVVGSANITEKALNQGSGEVCVLSENNMAAQEAWEVSERLFDSGVDLTRDLIATYERRFRRLVHARGTMSRAQRRWSRVRHRRRGAASVDPASSRLLAWPVQSLESRYYDAADEARRSASREGVDTGSSWTGLVDLEGWRRCDRGLRLLEVFVDDLDNPKQLRSMKVVEVTGRGRAVHPDTGRRNFYVVFNRGVRGWSAWVKKKDRPRAVRVLEKDGFNLRRLCTDHELRKPTRVRLMRVIRELKRLSK